MVFSTKQRTPWLTTGLREELYGYIVGLLRNQGCVPIQTGGVEDHVHILFGLSRTVTVAQVAEKVKSASSKWIKEKGLVEFSWQAGYGAFSISNGHVNAAVRYIQNQEEHHKSISYQDEFRALMEEAGMVIDERYVWD